MGVTNNMGYGIFWADDQRMLAHRYAWIAAGNPDPGKLFLLHNCDNTICVRPDHQRIGTPTDNMRDCLLRGRKNGRPHGRSRLIPEDVRAIRVRLKAGVNDLQEIADEYGITKGAVGHIKYGITWAWLQ